jgi:hypothetical protein
MTRETAEPRRNKRKTKFQRYGERYGISPTLFCSSNGLWKLRGFRTAIPIPLLDICQPGVVLNPVRHAMQIQLAISFSKHEYGSRVPWKGQNDKETETIQEGDEEFEADLRSSP